MVARSRQAIAALSLLLLAVAAQAHRQPGVVSRIEWSVDDQALHITHRLHAHDAVRLLTDGAGLDSLDGLAMVALHVDTQFALTTERDATPMPLQMIGAETEGDDVYVYQQLDLSEAPAQVHVANQLLDQFDGTANTVVLIVEGQTQSFVGAPSKVWRQIGTAIDGA